MLIGMSCSRPIAPGYCCRGEEECGADGGAPGTRCDRAKHRSLHHFVAKAVEETTLLAFV
jgi:hypothetical protein